MARKPNYILLQPTRGTTMMVNDEERMQELTGGGGFEVAEVVYDPFKVDDTMQLVEAEWENEQQQKQEQQANPDSLFDPQGVYSQIPVGSRVNHTNEENQIIRENIERLRDFEPESYKELREKIDALQKWKYADNPVFFQPKFFEERQMKREGRELLGKAKKELQKRGINTNEQDIVNEFDLPERYLTQDIKGPIGHLKEQLNIYGPALEKVKQRNKAIFGKEDLSDEEYQALQHLNQNGRVNLTQATNIVDALDIDRNPANLTNLSKDEIFELADINMDQARDMPSEEETIQSIEESIRQNNESMSGGQQQSEPQQQDSFASAFGNTTTNTPEQEPTVNQGSTYFGATANYSEPPSTETEYRDGASPEDERSYNNNNMTQSSGISTEITQTPTTVEQIAEKYGMSEEEVRRYNGGAIGPDGSIQRGASLMIPTDNFQNRPSGDDTSGDGTSGDQTDQGNNLIDSFSLDDIKEDAFLVQFHRNGQPNGPIYKVDKRTKQIIPFGTNQSNTWEALQNRYPNQSEAELQQYVENANNSALKNSFDGYNRIQPGKGITTDGTNQADADDINLDQVEEAYGKDLTQSQLEYGQLGVNQIISLAKEDSDINNTDINRFREQPGLIATWTTALAAGGYGVGDIVKDMKRRAKIADGADDLRNKKVISQTETKQDFQGSQSYQQAQSDPRLEMTTFMRNSDIDPGLFDKEIYNLPDSFWEEPTETSTAEDFQEKVDNVKVLMSDAAIKRIEARTEQEVTMAEHEFQKAKEKAERELDVQLENDAMKAWEQLEQLESKEKRNVVESGMVDEVRDRYLREMRKNLGRIRDEHERSAKENRMAYLMQYGTPEEIQNELSKEERKKLGFTPSQKFQDFFSKENLREQYPNASEEDYEKARQAVLDKNDNFRSNAYFTAMTDIMEQEEKKKNTQMKEVIKDLVNEEKQGHEEDMEAGSDSGDSDPGQHSSSSQEFEDIYGNIGQDDSTSSDTSETGTTDPEDTTTPDSTTSPDTTNRSPETKRETEMDEFDRAIETTRLNLIRDGASQKQYDTMMQRVKDINNTRRRSGGEALRIGDPIDDLEQERQNLSTKITEYDQNIYDSAEESRRTVEERLSRNRDQNNDDSQSQDDTYQPDDFGQEERDDVSDSVRDSYSPSDDSSSSSSDDGRTGFYAYRPSVNDDNEPDFISVTDESKVDDYIKQWKQRSGVDWAGRNKEDFNIN